MLVAVSLGCVSAPPVLAEVRIGVVAPRSYMDTVQRWSPLGAYLSQALKEKVEIVPLLAKQLIPATDEGKVDIFLSQNSHTVYVLEKTKGKLLVTLNTLEGPRFGGVILSKKGSGITTAKDVKGKRVSTSSKESAGGYHFQLYHLYKNGVREADLAEVVELHKQDNSLLALARGLVDVAFLRTGVFEQMVKEGSAKEGDYVIVDSRQNPEFNQVHSTDLYSEWYVTVTPKVSPELSKAMKAALLSITAESKVATHARIKGFVEPLDITPVREMLKQLKLAPYN